MKLILINSSPMPLYEQLKEQIKQGILRGDPAGGEMLPSIRGLAQSLSTSASAYFNTSQRLLHFLFTPA